ncbi:DUF7882 family protein [Microbacterium sp. NPDC055683]
MGRFIYGPGDAIDLDDRTLAHLRIIVMNKLRRSEPFMFDASPGEGMGRRSFWVHPAVPLQFQFHGGRSPRLNRAWLDDLMKAASGPTGLTITPEPPEPVDGGPAD